MSLGTPLSILAATLEAERVSAEAPHSSTRPPAPPTWAPAPSLPVQLASPSKPVMRPAVVAPVLTSAADLTLDEAIAFRSWPARHVWSIALVVVIAGSIAVLAVTQTRDSANAAIVSPVSAPRSGAAQPAAATPSLATTVAHGPGGPGLILAAPDDAPAQRGLTPSAPVPRAPATKAPAKAGAGAKDYGI